MDDKHSKKAKRARIEKDEDDVVDASAAAPVEDDEERRKAEKAARKAEKKARKAAAAEDEDEEDEDAKAARKAAKKAAKKEAAAAQEDEDDDAAEARRKAEKAARKAEKKAHKEAEAAGGAGDSDAVGGHKRKRKAGDDEEEDDAGETVKAVGGAGAMSGGGGASSSARWPAYTPSPAVAAMAQADVDAYRASKSIAVQDDEAGGAKGGDRWKPITSFAAAGDNFPPAVMRCTSTFTTPSPIQSQAWPIALSGRDMVGIAATGSGKTLAFMLPALVHIQARLAGCKVGKPGAALPAAAATGGAGGRGPIATPMMLVLAPTRELAMQTAKVATDGGAPAGVQSACIYGGVPKDAQRVELAGPAGRAKGAGSTGHRGVHIVIATPGRLRDLIEEGSICLSQVTYLVLDEADRMLDLGFEKDIRAILALQRSHDAGRQTLMFSATWPDSIRAIAAEFLTKPVRVTIGSAELSASKSVTQIVEVVDNPNDRDRILLNLLGKYHASRKNRVLVFVLYKKEAGRMESFLRGRGWECCAIHGDMTQDARTRSFNAFREGRIPLLIATDVAARGLDIPNVEYVINYSFPLTAEDYVHRIGRTGRGGATGTAHTLFTPLDKAHAGELVNVLREAGAAVPDALLKFGTHVKKKEHALYGAHFKAADKEGAAPMPSAPTRMTFD